MIMVRGRESNLSSGLSLFVIEVNEILVIFVNIIKVVKEILMKNWICSWFR